MSKRARNGTIMGGSRRPKRSGCVTAEGKIRWDDEKEPKPLPPLEWMPTHWKEDPMSRQAISAMRPLVACTEMCTPEQDHHYSWQFLSYNMVCAPPYLVYALVLIQRALQGVHVAQYQDKFHQTFDHIFRHQENYMMRMIWFSVAMRLTTKNQEDEYISPAKYVIRISEMCEHKMPTKAASDMELYLLQRMGWRCHVTLETYQRVVSLLCAYRPTDKWRRELSEACSSHDEDILSLLT